VHPELCTKGECTYNNDYLVVLFLRPLLQHCLPCLPCGQQHRAHNYHAPKADVKLQTSTLKPHPPKKLSRGLVLEMRSLLGSRRTVPRLDPLVSSVQFRTNRCQNARQLKLRRIATNAQCSSASPVVGMCTEQGTTQRRGKVRGGRPGLSCGRLMLGSS
jgi:hypothetical protein